QYFLICIKKTYDRIRVNSKFALQINVPLFAMNSSSPRVLFEALTYDDVLLLPGYSEVLPRDVNTKTKLTRNIELNLPFISAAMDTVTEYELAIAMAQEGGIGIINKN